MLSNKIRVYAGGTILVLVLLIGAVLGPRIVEGISNRTAAEQCAQSYKGDNAEVDCWAQIALSYMRNGDILAAYRAFDYLYGAYPGFAAWGCHVNAHRLGDTAYYQFFVTRGLELDQMDFPQQTTSCGYGFYHGFLEHLIQDHPQADYVIKTCEYLRGRLQNDMRDIARVCYHASGHGFIQEVADTLKKSDWGNIAKMVSGPLSKCEALPNRTELEIEECREGVFNVLSNWMVEKDFGLTFDYEDPFRSCDALSARWQRACYTEFGQKLQPIVGDNILAAEKYAGSIRDMELRHITFGVVVAGMMQRLAPLDQYQTVFTDCTLVKDEDLFHFCLVSATNGMMEHGDPGNEYRKILPMCSLPELTARNGTATCLHTLARRLSRFYTPEKKIEICTLFPEAYKTSCKDAP